MALRVSWKDLSAAKGAVLTKASTRAARGKWVRRGNEVGGGREGT